MVFLIGLPLFIVELSLGQYSALGPAHLYSNLAPILKGKWYILLQTEVFKSSFTLLIGVGFASIVAAFIVSTYYNMILAWTLYYFVEAFRGQNWQHCNNIGGRANNTESKTSFVNSQSALFPNEPCVISFLFHSNYLFYRRALFIRTLRLRWVCELCQGSILAHLGFHGSVLAIFDIPLAFFSKLLRKNFTHRNVVDANRKAFNLTKHLNCFNCALKLCFTH